MSKPTLAEEMLVTALGVREEYAAKLYDRDEANARIKAAALKGETHVRVVQDKAHDLELTEAALTLVAWLEAHGFKCIWFAVSMPEKIKGQPTGRQLGYRELSIEWAGKDASTGVREFVSSELEGVIANPEPT